MRATVDKDLLHASIGQKLKRILNEWGVYEGEQTLDVASSVSAASHKTQPGGGMKEG